MTLITCPDCGHYPVSDRAEVCPQCGCPIVTACNASPMVVGLTPSEVVIRRKKKSDEASELPIFIRVKSIDPPEKWSTKGFVLPGKTLTIPLKPGHYRIEACIGEDLEEDDIEWEEDLDEVDEVDDSESETIALSSGSIIRMTTRAWYGAHLYVDLESKD